MIKLIKQNLSIFFAVLLFIASISTFAISNAKANSTLANDCKNCGSISACDGGQPYGSQYCDIDEDKIGTPEGCATWGNDCGSQVQ